MRFAVVGDQGMFGYDLGWLLTERGIPFEGLHRSNFNLCNDPSAMASTLSNFEVVVNAAAFTAVDKAESHKDEANLVNGVYAGALAQASALAGARFIQISTDYVFDGNTKAPYKVADSVNPQNVYGTSKALGEKLVSESGANYSILRTAWLYGAGGQCFPKVMADLLEKNGSVRVVGDQFGQPTWTRDLADQVIQVAELETMPPIVHAVSSGKGSWADFAREVAVSLGFNPDVVTEISTEEYPTQARRPAWSVLDNSSSLLSVVGDWRERWRIAAPSVLAIS